MVVRVALVEDHAGTRNALIEVLADFAHRVQVVGAVADAPSFLALLKTQPVDVVLVDLGLPTMTGSELIRLLAASWPMVRALALTAFDDGANVLEAIRAGALGYLLKDETAERVVQSVEETAAGAHPISSRVAGFLMTHARMTPAEVSPVLLSDREEELAVALAEGLSYAECSERMGIALGTVQDYVKRVYRKLDVNSKKEVREWATRYAAPRPSAPRVK